MSKIKTGQKIKTSNSNWKFSGKVVEQFDQHILKSVPLYYEGHELIGSISDHFLQNGSIVYDLGCSTGTLIKKLNKRHKEKKIYFKGIEIERDMLKKAKKLNHEKNVTFLNKDLKNIKLKKNDLTICYYTIQFIPPRVRQEVINKIYKSLNWGGAFLFFEKVRGPDARFQDILQTLYTEYKMSQGYNEKEIIGKTLSLKGILEPFSSNANVEMLKRAGFKDINLIFKRLCFEGYLAIK